MMVVQSLFPASKTLSRSQCRYSSERLQYISLSSADIRFATFLCTICQTLTPHTADNRHSPLPLHGSTCEWRLPMLLCIVIPEARQIIISISVVWVASSLETFSRSILHTVLSWKYIQARDIPRDQRSLDHQDTVLSIDRLAKCAFY